MYKKYKVKKRHKFNIYYIFAILAISLLFMSYGYSLLSEKIEIHGTANVKVTESEKMNVEITSPYFGVASPGFNANCKSEIVNGELTMTLEKTGDFDVERPNNFSFFITNKTGHEATKGVAKVRVTGSIDGVGTIAPSGFETIPDNGMIQFFSNIPLNSAKIQKETKIEFLFEYLVNGETQSFKCYIIIKV